VILCKFSEVIISTQLAPLKIKPHQARIYERGKPGLLGGWKEKNAYMSKIFGSVF
jgi:hypothetical protein